MRADQAVLAWAAYLPWGLLQQYVLNGYFLNRLEAWFRGGRRPAISAALFSGAHTPNWFLMAVTLVAGYCLRADLPAVSESLLPGCGARHARVPAVAGGSGFHQPSPDRGTGLVHPVTAVCGNAPFPRRAQGVPEANTADCPPIFSNPVGS